MSDAAESQIAALLADNIELGRRLEACEASAEASAKDPDAERQLLQQINDLAADNEGLRLRIADLQTDLVTAELRAERYRRVSAAQSLLIAELAEFKAARELDDAVGEAIASGAALES